MTAQQETELRNLLEKVQRTIDRKFSRTIDLETALGTRGWEQLQTLLLTLDTYLGSEK